MRWSTPFKHCDRIRRDGSGAVDRGPLLRPVKDRGLRWRHRYPAAPRIVKANAAGAQRSAGAVSVNGLLYKELRGGADASLRTGNGADYLLGTMHPLPIAPVNRMLTRAGERVNRPPVRPTSVPGRRGPPAVEKTLVYQYLLR